MDVSIADDKIGLKVTKYSACLSNPIVSSHLQTCTPLYCTEKWTRFVLNEKLFAAAIHVCVEISNQFIGETFFCTYIVIFCHVIPLRRGNSTILVMRSPFFIRSTIFSCCCCWNIKVENEIFIEIKILFRLFEMKWQKCFDKRQWNVDGGKKMSKGSKW